MLVDVLDKVGCTISTSNSSQIHILEAPLDQHMHILETDKVRAITTKLVFVTTCNMLAALGNLSIKTMCNPMHRIDVIGMPITPFV